MNKMTTELSAGDLVTDRGVGDEDSEPQEEKDRMVVVEVTDEAADEYVFTWESDMTPVKVADKNPDEFAKDTVVLVVYIETLNNRYPELDPQDDIEEIQELVENSRLREYSFPCGRLEPVES